MTAAELIFGAWESARQRGRIEFPLTIDDNPLEAMIEDGQLALMDPRATNVVRRCPRRSPVEA